MPEPKTELTTLDLCKMFGVTRTTIYNWRKPKSKDGKVVREALPYYKLGGNGLSDPTRYALEAVTAFAKGIGRSPINQIF